MSLWNIFNAIEVARFFESELEKLGYHVALGGGVLLKGESDKDLDLFVYPHFKNGTDSFLDALAKIQVLVTEFTKCDFYKDCKTVYCCNYNGKRIDFFFVQ